jgi:hypothetical protein
MHISWSVAGSKGMIFCSWLRPILKKNVLNDATNEAAPIGWDCGCKIDVQMKNLTKKSKNLPRARWMLRQSFGRKFH